MPQRDDRHPKVGATQRLRPIKEAEDTFLHWITERDGDVTDQDRAMAKDRRAILRVNDLAQESYRRVSTQEALKRLASAGFDQA